jgi:hypothetical protein
MNDNQKAIRDLCVPVFDGQKAHVGIDGDAHPFAYDCKPLDEDRKGFLAKADKPWFSGSKSFAATKLNADLLKMRNAFVRFGGEEVCIPSLEDDLSKILSRGTLWPGHGAKRMPGRPSQCHENSCLCWEANQDRLFVATGYALSDDGMWRQHSWCVAPKGKGVTIIETTEPRELYFGFVMDLEETLDFGSENTDMGLGVSQETMARYAALGAKKPARSRSLG